MKPWKMDRRAGDARRVRHSKTSSRAARQRHWGFEQLEARQLLASDMPNIIVINTDDQRWDSLGFMPKLQAELAPNSTTFTNSFVTTPICAPSRASLFTGLYAFNHGVLHVEEPWGGFENFNDTSTLATWLDAAGYNTAMVGKYMNGYDQGADANSNPNDTYVPPGWDSWRAFLGASYVNPQISFDGVTHSFPGAYSTDVLSDLAVQFIDGNSPSDSTPFFLYFAPHNPHEPSLVAPRHVGVYDDLEPFRPPSYNEADVSDKPAWVSNQLPLLNANDIAAGDQFREDQLESMLSVDDGLGRMMDALRESGQIDNTVIIFTSDNGQAWGEHRLYDKGPSWDESIRVPLMVYDGRHPVAQVVDELALNIDLAPTIMEYAGLSLPQPVDGKSLLPLIDNEPVTWRDEFLVDKYVGDGGKYYSIRTTRWSYTEYTSGSRELYDLLNDPYELHSLHNDPAYASVRADLSARLSQLKPSDTTGPVTSNVHYQVDSSGFPKLTLTVSDATTGGSQLRNAEYFIGAAGNNGVGKAMRPVDGVYDSVTENMTVDFPNLAPGSYTVFVHGRDIAGNWGSFVSLPLQIAPSVQGLTGQYFNEIDLTGLAGTRVDPQVNFPQDWGSGPAGTGLTPDDNYSVRWTGFVETSTAGSWNFYTTSNDGVRLWIDDALVINNWTKHAVVENSTTLNLSSGWHSIRLEYYQAAGVADITLSFQGPGQAKTVIPASKLRVTAPAPEGPSLAIAAASASKNEGNSGSTPFTFTVTRTGDTSGTTTIEYAVSGSGASPANFADFGGSLPTDMLTFSPGQTSQTITVNVAGDMSVEPDETFTVTLSNPSGSAQITTAAALGLITNDDAQAGQSGLVGEYFNATNLTGLAGTRIDTTVNFPQDWGSSPPGTTVTPDDNFSVRWTGFVETSTAGSWTFFTTSNDGVRLWIDNALVIDNWNTHAVTQNSAALTLSAGWHAIRLEYFQQGGVAEATLSFQGPGQAKAIIPQSKLRTTDPGPGLTSLSISPSSANKNEGNAGTTPFTFTVSRSGNTSGTTTVNYAVTGSGASPADAADFGGALPSGVVTFTDGQTSQTITVNVTGDTEVESNEAFTVTLSGPSGGAQIAAATAAGAIVNDDVQASVAAAKLEVYTQGSISNSSTAKVDSFRLHNDSTGGRKISSVTIDLSTAFMSDIVFDPNGTAGDVVGINFMPNTGVAATGLTTNQFTSVHDGGFDSLTVNFNDFDPGELFTFRLDIDPTSVKGAAQPGPSDSASISGLEMSGATITVHYADGATLTGQLFALPEGAAFYKVHSEIVLNENAAPAAPVISLLNVATPSVVQTAAQKVHIVAPVGSTVRLVQTEVALYLAGVPGGGFDIDPYEANEVVSVRDDVVTVPASGFIDVNVTLRDTLTEGGINYFFATIDAPDGRTGPMSNVLKVALNNLPPGSNPGAQAAIVADPNESSFFGDYNGDGAVDGFDFLALQRSGGQSDAVQTWQAAFGASSQKAGDEEALQAVCGDFVAELQAANVTTRDAGLSQLTIEDFRHTVFLKNANLDEPWLRGQNGATRPLRREWQHKTQNSFTRATTHSGSVSSSEPAQRNVGEGTDPVTDEVAVTTSVSLASLDIAFDTL